MAALVAFGSIWYYVLRSSLGPLLLLRALASKALMLLAVVATVGIHTSDDAWLLVHYV